MKLRLRHGTSCLGRACHILVGLATGIKASRVEQLEHHQLSLPVDLLMLQLPAPSYTLLSLDLQVLRHLQLIRKLISISIDHQQLHIPSVILIHRQDATITSGHYEDSLWATVAVLAMAAVLPMLTLAADEDPLQDFCVADNSTGLTVNGFPCRPARKVSVSDFTSSLLKKPADTSKNINKAVVTQASILNFFGLNTLGISAARVDFEKGGINPPHTHPRATELLLVIKGELYVGFVHTNNQPWATTVREGELFVVPRGLMHFQLNVGQGEALAFTSFSSQNPGVQVIVPALFGSNPGVSDEVLEKGFRISEDTVKLIEKNFT